MQAELDESFALLVFMCGVWKLPAVGHSTPLSSPCCCIAEHGQRNSEIMIMLTSSGMGLRCDYAYMYCYISAVRKLWIHKNKPLILVVWIVSDLH
jgi:hypothetical protein